MCEYEFSGWDTLIASSSFWLKTPIVSLRPFLVNKYHDVCSSLKTKEHRAVLRTVHKAVSCAHVLHPPVLGSGHLFHRQDTGPPPTSPESPVHRASCGSPTRRSSFSKDKFVSTLYSSEPCKSCFSLESNCVNRRVILSIRACRSLYSLYSALKSFL